MPTPAGWPSLSLTAEAEEDPHLHFSFGITKTQRPHSLTHLSATGHTRQLPDSAVWGQADLPFPGGPPTGGAPRLCPTSKWSEGTALQLGGSTRNPQRREGLSGSRGVVSTWGERPPWEGAGLSICPHSHLPGALRGPLWDPGWAVLARTAERRAARDTLLLLPITGRL